MLVESILSCQEAINKTCHKNGVNLSVAIVEGDNLIEEKDLLEKESLKKIDSFKPLPKSLLSVNAYLGAPRN